MENTATPSATVSSTGLRYGLLTGVVSLILSAVMYLTGTEQSALRYLAYPILIGGIWMAHQHFKNGNAGFMSYGQGLGIGTILSAVVGVMSAVFLYVYASFIDSNFLNKMVENARTEMESSGKYSDEQVDQAMSITQGFMTMPALILMTVVFSILGGFIFSLIISAITKRNRPEFE